MLDLNAVADFTWSFSTEFFLETSNGNYIWSDPDYGGDNTIRKFSGTLTDWYEQSHIPFGRCKGRHKINNYCGKDVIIIQ